MFKLIKLAWRNMWRNWRRTLIASSAIVLGLVLLLLMDAMIQGSDQAIFGNAVRLYGGNIQIHASGFREKANRLPLIPMANTDEVLKTIAAKPEVMAASKRINTGGLVTGRGGSSPVMITAIEPEREAPISLIAENISHGRFLTSADQSAVVIGQGLADMLEVGVGDRITVMGRRQNEAMRQHSMTIVGIYDLGLAEAEKGTVFINLPDAQTLYNLRGQETEITISLINMNTETAVLNDLQAALPGYEVDSWHTLRPEIQETLETKAAFTSILGFIVLLIASIGILNLMMMAVFERTREMGVLAALGMKSRQIMALFVFEGMFIGVLGSVIGCTLGALLIWAIAQVGIEFAVTETMGEMGALMGNRLYPSIGLGDIISRGIAVVVIAALASFYPAWQASRQEPAEALHYV